jgi:hypothetical protein
LQKLGVKDIRELSENVLIEEEKEETRQIHIMAGMKEYQTTDNIMI